MNTKRINIFAYLLLLAVAASGGAACSLTKINAKSPNQQTETTRAESSKDSPKNEYKPPRRVSRDVIKKDEVKTDEKTAKTKIK